MPRPGRSRSALSGALLLLYGLVLAAPALVLIEFHLDREEIIRTLCVERYKPIAMNGCKGACQLSKRLDPAQADADEQEAPPRVETVVLTAVLDEQPDAFLRAPVQRCFPPATMGLEDGVRAVPDPVPWRA